MVHRPVDFAMHLMATMICPQMIVDADQFVSEVTVGSGIARPANLMGREANCL
jgi:hypothetical protein